MTTDTANPQISVDGSCEYPIPFDDANEVLGFLDESIQNGAQTIHPWQYRVNANICRIRKSNDDIVYQALVAANGSGKSQKCLAPTVTWLALAKRNSLSVVTTASGEQLDTQAFRYVSRLCQRCNIVTKNDIGGDTFKINYRAITNLVTGAVIDLFATDEPGKAEGRHPIDGAEMLIVVDEAKTVADNIFEALERCNGVSRRFDLSSPGDTSGYFFDVVTHPETPYTIERVTAFDCPHLRKSEIEWKIKKYGLHDPLIRSSIFAEFTSTQDSVVITREILKDCRKFAVDRTMQFGARRAGLDLSAGGDECVLQVFDGNVHIAQEAWRNLDTAKSVGIIIDLIGKWKLQPENIYADDGGIGRAMLDSLREKGFTVNRVLNQSRALDRTRYANRGTELWFNFKRFLEESQVQLISDTTLDQQLTNRYWRTQSGTGKLILESKFEARKKGHPSPDRADAMVLAWAPYIFPIETDTFNNPNPQKSLLTLDQVRQMIEDRDDKSLAMLGPIDANSSVAVNRNISARGQYVISNRFIGSSQSKYVDYILNKFRKHRKY